VNSALMYPDLARSDYWITRGYTRPRGTRAGSGMIIPNIERMGVSARRVNRISRCADKEESRAVT
jgi:hypothetical protein